MRIALKAITGVCLSTILYSVLLAQEAPFTGRVSSDDINIRASSTINSEVICRVNKGDLLKVAGKAYDWYKVKLPKTAAVFIKKDFVEILENAASGENYPCGKVLKEKVNVRLGPKDDSAIIGRAEKNELVTIQGEKSGWYRIAPVEKSYGWVHQKFLEAIPSPQILETNKQPNNSLILEGKVMPCGIVFRRTATHKLITSENKVYLLKGERKSLNALNYHRVRVTGKVTPNSQQNPTIEIEKVEVIN